MKSFCRLILLTVVAFVSLPSSSLTAGLLGNYRVSSKSVKMDQRRSVGSGSRSPKCQPSVSPGAIELIVPKQNVAHKTFSSRPPLYVYSRHTGLVSVNFNLIDLKNSENMESRQIELNPGVNKIDLAKSVSLSEGNIYTWNIAIPCLNDSNQNQSVLHAGIERVISPPDINRTKTKLELIEAYTTKGIWYESVVIAWDLANFSSHLLPNDSIVTNDDFGILKECFWKEDCIETKSTN